MSFSFDVFSHDPNPVVHDLEKTAFDGKATHITAPTNAQPTRAEQRHEWGVVRQNADLAIESGRDHRVGLTVEHRCLG
jgi:hypothetical protein